MPRLRQVSRSNTDDTLVLAMYDQLLDHRDDPIVEIASPEGQTAREIGATLSGGETG